MENNQSSAVVNDVDLLTELAILVELGCHQLPTMRNDDVSFRIVSKRTNFINVLDECLLFCPNEDGKKALIQMKDTLESYRNGEGLQPMYSEQLVIWLRATITALLSEK